MTEVWYRNPHSYIKELVEAGGNTVSWDRGALTKRRIEPFVHAKLYFGEINPFRLLLVGDQGTAELDQDHDLTNPKAVYPTWTFGEPIELLREMIEFPVGEDPQSCDAKLNGTAIDETPVLGQEHRVIVTEWPPSQTMQGKQFLKELAIMQEENPNCIIHLHGTYSWRIAFGLGFAAADIDPRWDAQKGKVILPPGKVMFWERTSHCQAWIHLLGFQVVDLKIPRNRCMYNIKSAQWAGEHWHENLKFRTRGPYDSLQHQLDVQRKPALSKSYRSSTGRAEQGDKFLCDTCSINLTCNYFRVGSVCSVPGAETSKLITAFKSRDSSKIIDGLGAIIGVQVERAERAIEDEEEFGETDPEVTKMLSTIFTEGVQLAKLLDPNLRGGAKIAIGVNTNGAAAAITAITPNQFVSQVISQYEADGIPRAKITPQMIEAKMEEFSKSEVVTGELVD